MRFESDVISDGTQTQRDFAAENYSFESDVISDGTQTKQIIDDMETRLRVM